MADKKQNDQYASKLGDNIPLGRVGPIRGTVPIQRAADSKQTVFRIWGYLAKHRAGLIVTISMVILAALLTLTAPYLLGIAIDHYIMVSVYDGFARVCLLLLVVYAGSALLSWLQGYIMVGLSQRIVLQLRTDIFAQLQKAPLRFFDTRAHGDLMSRATNDIDQISTVMNHSVTQLVSSFVMITGALIFMFFLNIQLAIISLCMIPIVTIITRKIADFTRRYFREQQTMLGELNGFIEETLSGQKIVNLFSQESRKKAEFHVMNQRLREASIHAQVSSGVLPPVMNAMNNISFAIIAAIGGWMALHSMTSVGIVVSFLHYSKQFSRPVNELANQFNLLQSAVAGAERVFEMIDTPAEYDQEMTEEGELATKVKGDIVFENVSFSYQDRKSVLKGISFEAKSGETVAFVGPTGAGKTTIINVLTRFYEIDSGKITLDGVDIRTLEKQILRKQIGLVLQDVYLFYGTIRENIRYGKLDASDEDVIKAAKMANADSFIQRLPNGYDTVLMAEGANLSQGQRQLLNIARVMLADLPILILDEATSSIDTRTEMHIQRALEALKTGRTCLIIAHRLNTIREADRILVIDDGRIIEKGSHQQLIDNRGMYYAMYTT